MTTSGTTNFSLSRNQIITSALQAIRVLGEDELPSSAALASGNIALNVVVKSFENQSKHVWKKSECTLFLQKGQISYLLGTGSTDNCTESYVQSTVSSTVASGTTLVVGSTTGMLATQNIGIVLDSGSLYWTTISVVNSSTNLTLVGAIPSSATAGNVVYCYATSIFKPLKIYGARREKVATLVDTPIRELSYSAYQNLPTKSVNGSVVQYSYQRNNNNGILYVWSPAQDVTDILKISYAPSFQDFDNTADTPDFPQEWYKVLIFGLACDLAHPYGKATGDAFQALQASYIESLKEALAFDVESTYIKLVPGRN